MKNLETAEAIKNINKTYNSKESNYKTGAPIVGNSLEQRVFASRNDINKIKELLSNSNLKLNLEHRKYLESFNNLFSEYSELNEQLESIINFYKENLTDVSFKFTPQNPFIFDEESNSMWKLSNDGEYFEFKNIFNLDINEIDFIFKIYNIGFRIENNIQIETNISSSQLIREYYINNIIENNNSFSKIYNPEDYEGNEIEFKIKFKFNNLNNDKYIRIKTSFFKNYSSRHFYDNYHRISSLLKYSSDYKLDRYFDIEIPEEDRENLLINNNDTYPIKLGTGYIINDGEYRNNKNSFSSSGSIQNTYNYSFDDSERINIPVGEYNWDEYILYNDGYTKYDKENDIIYWNVQNNSYFYLYNQNYIFNNSNKILKFRFKNNNFSLIDSNVTIKKYENDIKEIFIYNSENRLYLNDSNERNVNKYVKLENPKLIIENEIFYYPNQSMYNGFSYFFDPLKVPESISDNKIIHNLYYQNNCNGVEIRYHDKTNLNNVKLFIDDIEYPLTNENTFTNIMNCQVTKIKFDSVRTRVDVRLEYTVNDATVKEPFYYNLTACYENMDFLENLNKLSKYIVSKDNDINVCENAISTQFDNGNNFLNKPIGFRDLIDNESVFGIENNPLNNEESVVDGVKISNDTTFEIEHQMRSIAFSILNRPNSSINITDQSEEIVENNFDTFEDEVEREDTISKHIKNISMNLGRQNVPNQVKVTVDGLNENDENNNLSLKDFIVEYKENYTSLKIKNPKNYLGFNIRIEPRFDRINNRNYFSSSDYYLFNVECNGNFNINQPRNGNNYSNPLFYMNSNDYYYDDNNHSYYCANFNISRIDNNVDEITLNITHCYNDDSFIHTLSSLPIYYNNKNVKKILLKYKINCSDEIKTNQSENFHFDLNFKTGQNIEIPLDFNHLGESQEYELNLTNDYFGENGIEMMFNLINIDWINGNYNSNTDTFFLNIEDILFISEEENMNNVFIKNQDVTIEEGDYYKLIDFNTNPCNKLDLSFFGNKETNNEIVKTRITSEQIRTSEGYSDTLITDDNIEYGINIDENNSDELSIDINIPNGNNKLDFEMKLPDGYNIFNDNSTSNYANNFYVVEVYVNDNSRPITLHNAVLLTNTWNNFSFDLDPSRANKITIKIWQVNSLFSLINGTKIIRNIEYYNENISAENKIDLTTALVGEKSDKITIAENDNNALFYDLNEEENNENEEEENEESEEEIIDVVSIKFMDNISFFMQNAALTNCEFYIDDELINNIFKNKYVNGLGGNSENYNSENYDSESYGSESYNSENYNSGSVGFSQNFVPVNIDVNDNQEHILTLKINRNGVLYGGTNNGTSGDSESYNSESYSSESYNSENYNSNVDPYTYDKTQNLIYDVSSNRNDNIVLVFSDNELISKFYLSDNINNFIVYFTEVKSRNIKLLIESKENDYDINIGNIKYHNIPIVTFTDIEGVNKILDRDDIQYFEKSYDENLNRNVNINVSNINNGNFVYLFDSNIKYKKFIILKNFDILSNEFNRYNFKNEIIDNEREICKLTYKTLVGDDNIYLNCQYHLRAAEENEFNKPEDIDIENINDLFFAKNNVNGKYKVIVKTFSITRRFKYIYFNYKATGFDRLEITIVGNDNENPYYYNGVIDNNYNSSFGQYVNNGEYDGEYTVSFLLISKNITPYYTLDDIFYDDIRFNYGYDDEYRVTVDDFNNSGKFNSFSINNKYYNSYLYNNYYFAIKFNKQCQNITISDNQGLYKPIIFIDGELKFIYNSQYVYNIEINELENEDHEIIILSSHYYKFSNIPNYLTITCDNENIDLQELLNNNENAYENINLNYEEEKFYKNNENDNYVFLFDYNNGKYLSFTKNCYQIKFRYRGINTNNNGANVYIYIDGIRYSDFYYNRTYDDYYEIYLDDEKEHEFFIYSNCNNNCNLILNDFTYNEGNAINSLDNLNQVEFAKKLTDNNLKNFNSLVPFFNDKFNIKIITLKVRCTEIEFYSKYGEYGKSLNAYLLIDNDIESMKYINSNSSSYYRNNFTNLEDKEHLFIWILIGNYYIDNIRYRNLDDNIINQIKIDNEIFDINSNSNVINNYLLDNTTDHDIEITYNKKYFTYSKVLINNIEKRNIKFNYNNDCMYLSSFINYILYNKNTILPNILNTNNIEEFDLCNFDSDNNDRIITLFKCDVCEYYKQKNEFNINLKLKEKYDLDKFFTYFEIDRNNVNNYSYTIDTTDFKVKRNINIKFKSDNFETIHSYSVTKYRINLFYDLSNFNIEQIFKKNKRNILKSIKSFENVNEFSITDETNIFNGLKNKFDNLNLKIIEDNNNLNTKTLGSYINNYKNNLSIKSTPFYINRKGIKIISLTETCSKLSFKYKIYYSTNSRIYLYIDGQYYNKYSNSGNDAGWYSSSDITVEQGEHEFTWVLSCQNYNYEVCIDEIAIDNEIITDYSKFSNSSSNELINNNVDNLYKYNTSTKSTPFYSRNTIKIVSLTETCNMMSFIYKTYSSGSDNILRGGYIYLYIDGQYYNKYNSNNNWSSSGDITVEQGEHEFTWVLYSYSGYYSCIDEIKINDLMVIEYGKFKNYNHNIPLGSIPDNNSIYKSDPSIESTPFYNDTIGIKIVSLTETCSKMSFRFKGYIIFYIDGEYYIEYTYNIASWYSSGDIAVEQGRHEFTWVLYNYGSSSDYYSCIDEIAIDDIIITDYNKFSNIYNHELIYINGYKYNSSIDSTPFYIDKNGIKIVSLTETCSKISFRYRSCNINGYYSRIYLYIDGEYYNEYYSNQEWSSSGNIGVKQGEHKFTWILNFEASSNYYTCIDQITIDDVMITDYGKFNNNSIFGAYKNKFEYVDDFNINKFSNHFEKINEENYNNFELSAKKNKIFKVSTIKYSQLEGLIKSPDIIDMVVSNENGDNIILTTKSKERMFKRDISNNEPNFSFVMKSDKNSIGSLKISNIKTEIDSQNMNKVVTSGIDDVENSTRGYDNSIDDISFGNDYEEVR